LRLLWLSCGEQDSVLSSVQAMHSTLDGKSVSHEWHTQAGQHEWPVWKTDLYYFAPILFKG
jgi:enterochelin esterase-like enzyme